MTGSFERIGELYDLMVPWESRLAREEPFFRKWFGEGRKRILDAACGTGRHALMFEQMGHMVTGTDISESCLTVARGLASEQGVPITFVKSDLLAPGEVLNDQHFDVITILGNSLAQFLKPDELARIFGWVRGKLTDGGRLIFQIVNFFSSSVRSERFAPLRTAQRDNGHILFQKFFDFTGDAVILNLLIFMEEEHKWSRQIESTPLRPWKIEEMKQLLLSAGLGSITAFGDFAGAPFDPAQSKDLICVASPGVG